ncbi:MAG TPA: flagellar hook-basal body complex protein FliE [Xanthobacteraceae bacterium]|nr:flagellar hook-basal body complex protein FliE [Xanthobacteraceae bacterium]
MPSPSTAAQAYANLARLTESNLQRSGEVASGESFSSLLKGALAAVNEAGQNADRQAQAMATGKANIVDVVTAVAESEVAIDAVVAVRDKVIQAYEEIMKMPI